MSETVIELPNLDEKKVAQMTGRKKETLQKMRFLGRGPVFYKLGARVFYKRSDVQAWIESQRIDPARRRARR